MHLTPVQHRRLRGFEKDGGYVHHEVCYADRQLSTKAMCMAKGEIPSFEAYRRAQVTDLRTWWQTTNMMPRCKKNELGSLHLALDPATHEIQANKANKCFRLGRSKDFVGIRFLLLPLPLKFYPLSQITLLCGCHRRNTL